MIQEMEQAITKREQIAVRHKGKSDAAAGRASKTRGVGRSAGGAGAGLGELTTAALKKKVSCTEQSLGRSDARLFGDSLPLKAVHAVDRFLTRAGGEVIVQ